MRRGLVVGPTRGRHVGHADVAAVPGRQRLRHLGDPARAVEPDLHVVGAERAVEVAERDHVAAGVLMLALGVLLFMPGWFGGGDAKLLAAIGLWIGTENLMAYMLWVALAGGVIAAAFLAARSVPLPRVLLGEAWALRLHRHDSGIPYGLALAAGALLVYPQTAWFSALAG